MLVADIYNTKIFPIQEDMSVAEAMQVFLEKNYNGVLVLNKKKELVGIFSLQDIAAATVPFEMQDNITLAQAMFKSGFFEEQCQEIGRKKVKDIMRTSSIVAKPETDIMEIAADFLQHDLYIVPVINEQKQTIGIITRTQIRKALAKGMGLTLPQERK